METCSLLDYRKRPHTTNQNFDGVLVSDLVQSIAKWRSQQSVELAIPEDLAIQFYLTNSAVAALQLKLESQQPLTPVQTWVMDTYYQALTDIGLRCFFYTFLICTREARHGNYKAVAADLNKTYGHDISFFNSIPDDPDAIMAHLGASLWTSKFSLKQFTQLLVQAFEDGIFGSSYGGAKWAEVARPLRDFVNGLTTMEMFCDTVWTLAHNGGPIFNKGMMFKGYKLAHLVKILDVQRAGMIPSLVEFDESVFVTASHHEFLIKARVDLAEFGTTKIDWQKVVELGAVGGYAVNAKANTNPSTPKPAPIPGNKLQITATEYVTKIKRKEFDQ